MNFCDFIIVEAYERSLTKKGGPDVETKLSSENAEHEDQSTSDRELLNYKRSEKGIFPQAFQQNLEACGNNETIQGNDLLDLRD